MSSTQTVSLIGATGLIGHQIFLQLCSDSYFQEIRLIVRRPYKIDNPRVKVIQIDFSDYDSLKQAIAGSHSVFCAVGSTRQKTPQTEAYRKVDVDIPVNIAKICEETGVGNLLLVSSVGADSAGKNIYLQMKGIVEDSVSTRKIPSISIFRPSLLLGKRTQKRWSEQIAAVVMRIIYRITPDIYKPIEAHQVAWAMVRAAKKATPGIHILHFNEMHQL